MVIFPHLLQKFLEPGFPFLEFKWSFISFSFTAASSPAYGGCLAIQVAWASNGLREKLTEIAVPLFSTLIGFQNTPSQTSSFPVLCAGRQLTERLGQAKGSGIENVAVNYSISVKKQQVDVKHLSIY